MKRALVKAAGWTYRNVGTKIFFRFESDPMHHLVLNMGQAMGAIPGMPALLSGMFRVRYPELASKVAGIRFESPIGLSAGFDHEAQLPRIVGSLGFGFESIGTVTNKPYGGNPMPQMKRLVRSQAILVNKGFKSSGIDAVLRRLKDAKFPVPVGISIGRTNTMEHKDHADAVADIREAFDKVERSDVPFSYYELNISCPNLLKDISFYPPERFDGLLSALAPRRLKRPLFVKMPTILTDEGTTALLDIAMRHGAAAVTLGNLRRDRQGPGFIPEEIASMEPYRGNWAGKPAQHRSDELVALAYRHTKGELPIIGCGGIFTAQDAYRKIRLGASLVQLAAGAVFMGPQVASEICIGLHESLRRDRLSRLSEAVGADSP